jgi:hypothetical protein
MRKTLNDRPYVTSDLEDAEMQARIRSFRTKRPYFWGVRAGVRGDEYIAAPYKHFDRFADLGWLLYGTCGKPREQFANTGASVMSEYTEALAEALLRVHVAKVATGIAVRGEPGCISYMVIPLEMRERMEAVDWQMCAEFLPG